MLKLKAHKRFEKDVKLAIKRGKKTDRLWAVVEQLQANTDPIVWSVAGPRA